MPNIFDVGGPARRHLALHGPRTGDLSSPRLFENLDFWLIEYVYFWLIEPVDENI